MPRISDCSIRRGRWLLPVAALVVSVAVTVPTGTLAQRVAPEVPPVKVPGGGTGGGAGLLPPTPSVRSLPYIAPAPSVTPAPRCCPRGVRQPLSPLHRRFASAASSSRAQKRARNRWAPTAVEETTSAIARATTATTIRPVPGMREAVNAAKKWVHGPLAVLWQRPYKDDPKPPGGACRGGFYCFDSLNRRLLPQGTFPVGHVSDVN